MVGSLSAAHLPVYGRKTTGAAAPANKANATAQATAYAASPAVVFNLLQKALAAVDVHLVGSLSTLRAYDASPQQLEVALLLRLDRSLRAQQQSLSQRLATDGVLCDSLAEFAATATHTVNALQADTTQRTACLLAFLEDLLRETMLYKSAKHPQLRQRLQQLRQAVVKAEAAHMMQTLYDDLTAELESLCPRVAMTRLDALLQTPTPASGHAQQLQP